METLEPNQITKSNLLHLYENPTMKAILHCLLQEKIMFSDLALQSRTIYMKEFDRYMSLKLGAIEQLNKFLDIEQMTSLLEMHGMLKEVKEDEEQL